MTLVDDLEDAHALTALLRKRERELFLELTAELGRGVPPGRIDGWLRALGLWFDEARGFVPGMMTDLIDVDGARDFLRACLPFATNEGTRQIRVALARLGFPGRDVAALLEIVPAGVALQIVDALDLRLADDGALAARLADALGAPDPMRRLAIAEGTKLPMTARHLGAHAATVLRVLLEDEALRPFFADRAARLWLELDLHDALPAALGVADEVSSMTLLALAATIDREEAFDVLAARFARDPFFCELLSRAGGPLVDGDDRWIPLALARLERDSSSAVRLVTRVATPRAAEELAGIIEHAAVIDTLLVEAFEGLVAVGAPADVIAQLFRGPLAGRLADAPLWRRVRDAVSPVAAAVRDALADDVAALRVFERAAAPPRPFAVDESDEW